LISDREARIGRGKELLRMRSDPTPQASGTMGVLDGEFSCFDSDGCCIYINFVESDLRMGLQNMGNSG